MFISSQEAMVNKLRVQNELLRFHISFHYVFWDYSFSATFDEILRNGEKYV
jgi:hypothetical protein